MPTRPRKPPLVRAGWVVLYGDAEPVRDALKGMGVVWDRETQRWWAPPETWEAAQNAIDDAPRRKRPHPVPSHWVPVSGNTRPVRHVLRGMGLRWDTKTQRWYAAPEKWEAAQNFVDDEMAKWREEREAMRKAPDA